MRLRKEGTHAMGEESIFSAGFFEYKIKALQVRHTFENDYFDVVLGSVRKIWIRKKNLNVSLQQLLWIQS